ncbi:MAG: zinc ribbon domain-containing protein [Clostridia bacterium]|nr:zinc ribbon domain-containing protein [Clostridia bacterium]
MAFCSKCGKEVPAETKFCPYCGAAVAEPEKSERTAPDIKLNTNDAKGQLAGYFNTKTVEKTEEERADANNVKNKIMAILAYAVAISLAFSAMTTNRLGGILIEIIFVGGILLVPFFVGKNSPFARFHTNNGLILSICAIGLLILRWLNWLIFVKKDSFYGVTYVIKRHFPFYIFNVLFIIAAIAIVVLAIFGIVHAAKGNKKDLPIVGGVKIIK